MDPAAGSWRVLATFSVVCLTLIAAGLAVVTQPAVQHAVAEPLVAAIAVAAEAIVSALGGGIARNGNVLTHLASGATVHVTQACDGLGVFVTFAAIVLALRLGRAATLRALGALFLAIQAFNLVRVIALYALRPGAPWLYDGIHLYVMPYLTAIIGLLVIWQAGMRGRTEGTARSR